MRTVHISDLEKCSRLLKCSRLFADIFFLLLAVSFSPSCAYSLTVKGLPDWVRSAAERGLNAVWKEIPSDANTDREATLNIVASRLFSGYSVDITPGRNEPSVTFEPAGTLSSPDVRLIFPEMDGRILSWLSADTAGLAELVSQISGQIPPEALIWADEALREVCVKIFSSSLPGWDFTQQIYIASSAVITYSFRPSSEMVLSIRPEITSHTIPSIFRTDLEARLIPHLSFLMGLPVKWVSKHRPEIERIAFQFLEERRAVGNMKADVSVKFRPGKISGIQAHADSQQLMFSLWLSAYAGIEGRYPEAGIYFGLRPSWHFGSSYNFAPQLYTEMIFSVNDGSFSGKFGGKLELFPLLWAGLEYEIPIGQTFIRAEYIPSAEMRLYWYIRVGLSSGHHEAGIGLRFDEHISSELYYNGKIGLRGKWNL